MPGLRVVHLLSPARFGGLERVVEMLAVGQQARGHEVHVVASLTSDGQDHPFLATLARRGVPTTVLTGSGRNYLGERRRLHLLLRQLQPQVAHTHGYRSDVLVRPVAAALGIATVSTAHGFTGGGWKNRMFEWLQRRAWRRFGAVVAVSGPLHARLLASGLPAARLHRVANAWSPEGAPLARAEARAELRLPPDRILVGWVGRLSREKGADVMLASLARLSGADVGLVIMGAGPERAALEAQAARLGIADRVYWTGAVPGAGRYYTAFDAFALSSRTEGTPIALFEAISAGVPVIATAVGGVPDVVSPKEAVLVASEQPALLAEAVTAVLADRAASAARAAAAALRLEVRFGLAPWIDAYDCIYQDLLRARPKLAGAD